ncbi:hypothetical protein LINPERHAP2_LOCUS32067 [Linum perenne]
MGPPRFRCATLIFCYILTTCLATIIIK